jgi:sec-independent protein translocase protein TatB
MFDIGFSEVLLIFGLALVVLGPDKLPGVARTVGRWAGRARAMARQFRDQLESEADGLKVDLNTPPQSSSTPQSPPSSSAAPPPEAPQTPVPSPPAATSPQAASPTETSPPSVVPRAGPADPWIPPPDSPHGETPPAPPPESLSSIDTPHDRRE